MKEHNQGITLFDKLLNQIADVKSKPIKPDDFAERSHNAYQVLLNDLDAYLFEGDVYHLDRHQEINARIDLLRARADQIIAIHKQISGNINISPYRASLAMYMSTQFTELLATIHPDNIMKR